VQKAGREDVKRYQAGNYGDPRFEEQDQRNQPAGDEIAMSKLIFEEFGIAVALRFMLNRGVAAARSADVAGIGRAGARSQILGQPSPPPIIAPAAT
jgi:hypothetical protein